MQPRCGRNWSLSPTGRRQSGLYAGRSTACSSRSRAEGSRARLLRPTRKSGVDCGPFKTAKLWRSFERYDARCSLRTWVYRVAHHVAASHVLRERRVFSKLVSLEELEILPDKDQDRFAAEQRINLGRPSMLIQRLKPLDRQVIVSYLEDMDAASVEKSQIHRRECGHADTPDQEHPGAAVSRRRQPCLTIPLKTTPERFGKISPRSHL